MGDAIEYCTGCETNQMCHMERKCMGREIAGDCKGSGGVCGEPFPDCDGVGWLESDITSKNRHCSASSGSLIRNRSTNLMLYSWGLGFGMTNLVWGILDGMPTWPLHLAGLGCVIAAVCVYVSKGLLTGDVSIPSENSQDDS